MTSKASMVEIETGVVVEVFTPYPWGDSEMTSTVTYPSGRSYSVPRSKLMLHFELPQAATINVFGYAGVDERPTLAQAQKEKPPGT